MHHLVEEEVNYQEQVALEVNHLVQELLEVQEVPLMKELVAWQARSPPIPWWASTRPLRVATDCSGMRVPEMTLTMLRENGRSTHNVFACDVMKAAQQQWMDYPGLEPLLADVNMRIWNKDMLVMASESRCTTQNAEHN